MALFESIVSGLNPDVEKNKFRFQNTIWKDEPIMEVMESTILPELFLTNHKIISVEEDIKTEIVNISKLQDNWNGQGSKKISAEVINNTIDLVNSIPPSILCYINKDNIYPSKFGTIIIDWEFGSAPNVFSLEIAKNSVGYFMEHDGEDIKQIENLSLSQESFHDTISSIINDLVYLL